jgi:hypothetical protein
MAGILTPASTAGDAPAAPQAKPATPVPTVGTQPPNTLSMNSPLAGTALPNGAGAPPIHSNEAINAALSAAFRPIIPDQINSLLGPAIGQIQGHTNPIAFYQPRPAAQIATRRSS